VDRDNVIDLAERKARGVRQIDLYVADVDAPSEDVFVDDERVIIRTPHNSGMAMTPLKAKELAMRLIEAACQVEQS